MQPTIVAEFRSNLGAYYFVNIAQKTVNNNKHEAKTVELHSESLGFFYSPISTYRLTILKSQTFIKYIHKNPFEYKHYSTPTSVNNREKSLV